MRQFIDRYVLHIVDKLSTNLTNHSFEIINNLNLFLYTSQEKWINVFVPYYRKPKPANHEKLSLYSFHPSLYSLFIAG
ncbi:hypothetical protein SAMN02787074_1768 [Chryseobacterium sp. YR221]|nr:hypothetical protein SAMN02787074_1768 [Chryseobacterium sp. YR221]